LLTVMRQPVRSSMALMFCPPEPMILPTAPWGTVNVSATTFGFGAVGVCPSRNGPPAVPTMPPARGGPDDGAQAAPPLHAPHMPPSTALVGFGNGLLGRRRIKGEDAGVKRCWSTDKFSSVVRTQKQRNSIAVQFGVSSGQICEEVSIALIRAVDLLGLVICDQVSDGRCPLAVDCLIPAA
jgi:hypothetical protein